MCSFTPTFSRILLGGKGYVLCSVRAVGVQRSAGRRGRRILLASSVTSNTFHDHVLLVSLLLHSRLTIGSSGGKGIQRQVRVLRAVLQVTLP